MRHPLSAAALFAVALATLGLSACDAADRAALAGLKAPVAAPTPAQTMPPATAHAALLFPPAMRAPAPRRLQASTPPHRLGPHRHPVRIAASRHYQRVHTTAHAEQTVTHETYADDLQIRRRAEAEARWDERRSTYAEGYSAESHESERYGSDRYGAGRYGRDDVRTTRAAQVAGRDRDGFLPWPGKTPDRR